jgi:outer membrane immunogenic protein
MYGFASKFENEILKMKRILVAAAFSALATISAHAADLAARPYTKAPPPIALAMYDWSGFYVGVNGGYGSSHKCWDFVLFSGALSPEGCHDATGGVAGGQIGYRWQMSSLVFGIEAQGDWANLKGSNVSLVGGDTNRSRINSFGLFTGQIGYAWNSVLLYAKGGSAVTTDRYDTFAGPGFALFAGVPVGSFLTSASETRWGGTAGLGLEYGFAPNWSVAFEYDHLFMGTRNISFTAPDGSFAGSDHIKQDVDLATVRVNYRFGGPVVAKY